MSRRMQSRTVGWLLATCVLTLATSAGLGQPDPPPLTELASSDSGRRALPPLPPVAGVSAAAESLQLTVPTRMVHDKTLTLKAEILDAAGNVDWQTWTTLGTVFARRASDQSLIGTSVTVFEDHPEGIGAGGPPPDTIRFYNGMGTVSITLDDPSAHAGEVIEVHVTVGELEASRSVTVLDGTDPGLYYVPIGVLTGAELSWGPEDGVIHLTNDVFVRNGDTLTIAPGTLIMVDPGDPDDGTAIDVTDSTINALGTADEPIFFFSTSGPAGMTLPDDQVNNHASWRGIFHRGDGLATYRHIILTGAGNAFIQGHPRSPVIRVGHPDSLVVEDSVFADSPGRIIHGGSGGSYTIRRSVFSRVGIGLITVASGHDLLVEDCWFTRVGRAPQTIVEPGDGFDGDTLHLDNSSNQLVRRVVLADGGDDGIDHSAGFPVLEDTIIWNVRDKAVSLTGGGVTFDNVLVFDTRSGIRGGGGDPPEPSAIVVRNSTLAIPSSITNAEGGTVAIDDSIFTSSLFLGACDGNINYVLGPSSAHLACGVGNVSSGNPRFRDPASCDYTLLDTSPAAGAGPTGGDLGWIGFPQCTLDAECDDGNPCTADSCASGGVCVNEPGNEGMACDDGLACTAADACASGVCTGGDVCPPGESCGSSGECAVEPDEVRFQNGTTYDGTHDTFLDEQSPNTVHGADPEWEWDLAVGTTDDVTVGLLRFDDVVGGGAGQVPLGAEVLSATLSLVIVDPGAAPAAAIHQVEVDWDEATATHQNFGPSPGLDPADLGPLVTLAPTFAGPVAIDVTGAVRQWVTDPATNRGLAFVPNSTNGVGVLSSENAIVADRPALTIQYAIVACTVDGDCDDGNACNGTESCTAGSCLPGTPVECDDGVDCTLDSCEEMTGSCSHLADDGFCDDDAFCNGSESCDAATGCQPGIAPGTDDGVSCTVGSCDEVNDTIVQTPDDGLCDDGSFCNGVESCDAIADCQPGQAPDLEDGVSCTVGSCDETNDVVVQVPADELCEDTLFCNGAETCDAVLDCQAGVPPELDDGEGCTVDSCDEATDEIVHLPDDDACGFGIELLFDDPQAMRWTDATGFERWNYYRGDLSVLIGEGTYTQSPGSNPLAARLCGLDATSSVDDAMPTSGQVAFVLVTGMSGAVESGLGVDASGVFRANSDPCP